MMNTKKIILVAVCLIILPASLWVGASYWKNFRGVWPAITPAPQDITKLIENANINAGLQPLAAGENVKFPLTLPKGFSISIFAKGLANARVLARDPEGVVFVSEPAQGKVVALPDADRDGIADSTVSILTGLNSPHGVAFHDGKLYVAETDAIAMYDYTDRKATNRRVIASLPSGGGHFTRTIAFGPDGKLYVTVGSSCNVCKESDSQRGAMLRMDADGGNLESYATGLRNTVFFTWRPGTEELWGNDMGRDNLGDNLPPDEINIIKQGKFYGWPYCYGKNVDDPFGGKTSDTLCPTAEPSHYNYQAHSAPLGMQFYTGSLFPAEYNNNLFVAFHGSWNRSVPTGYSIARLIVDNQGNVTKGESFISGWLDDGGSLGRPVDILQDSDGSLLVSDDKAGVVYRVSYNTSNP